MFYFLDYHENGDFTLKSEKGQTITGHGPEELFSLPEEKSFIYDPNLSITRYLVGPDAWDECVNSFKDGQTNKLVKGSLTFVNAKNVATNLSINKVKTLKREYKKMPLSQAALVRERLKELSYPDFKCWLNNAAYFEVIRYLNPGGMIGYNSDFVNIELVANAWDIKSAYPAVMLYERFPTSFLKVVKTNDIKLLKIYRYWIARFKIIDVQLKEGRYIDWLPRNAEGVYSFTSVDFEMFTTDYIYTWLELEAIIIHPDMEPLPESIRDFIKKSLIIKNEKKKTSYMYEEAKRNCNIIYGIFYQIPQRQDTKNNYRMSMLDEKRRPSIVGVWVTSYARYRLWQAMSIQPEAVIYWNTDGFVTLADISEEIQKLNIYKKFDIGNFILKHAYTDTIIFGNSQIYIGGKLKCAGLSSKGGNQYLHDRNIKPYKGMIIPPEYSGRWIYSDGKIVNVPYTLGGNNL